MKARRLLGVILLAVATSVGLVAPAVATPYGPHTGDATTSQTRVVQGHSVQVSGDGFCPDTPVVVTVSQGSDTYITKTIQADSSGVAATSVTLTEIGRNHIKLTGCHPAGGTLVLSAAVQVLPHQASLHASEKKVHKGDTVDVRGRGFCKHTKVKVRVYDDGKRYQAKSIRADRHGKAATSIKLTRAGRNTITLEGCRKAGGQLLRSATVKVRKGHSFRSSPAAYMGDLAGSVQPTAYVVAGGSLLLLLGATQLMFARRRRSSAATIEPNG
jgi:hypothetical protein